MVNAGLRASAGFRTYATAFLVSEAGSAVSLIAMPILVYQLTSSPLWTAAIGAVSAVPYFVLGLLAGTIADRHNRAGLMVGANLISGLALLWIPLAYRLGHLSAPQIIVAALISQSAFVFYDAANFGYLVSLVGRNEILAANGFLYSAMSALEAVAPALVGLTLSHLAVAYFIFLDAVSFLVSAIIISRIPATPVPVSEPLAAAPGLVADVLEGLRYFFENKLVGRMTLISALMTAANGGVTSILIVWATRAYGIGTDDSRIGLFYVAMAVSGVGAGKAAAAVGRRWSTDLAIKVFVPLSAVLGYLMLLAPTWWLAAILLGLSSGCGLAGVITAVTVRQKVIPDRLQSRVNTVGRMLAFGLGFSVGAVIAGSLGQALPITLALACVLLIRVVAVGVTYLPGEAAGPETAEAEHHTAVRHHRRAFI
jgi:MFS family permease